MVARGEEEKVMHSKVDLAVLVPAMVARREEVEQETVSDRALTEARVKKVAAMAGGVKV